MYRVLIIENELSLLKMVGANLIASGYGVVTASSGEEGLRTAGHDRPDLILLDMKMAGMSGWDVLRAIKSSTCVSSIPVVLMSASLTDGDSAITLERGARGLLAKPFRLKDLLNTVRDALEQEGASHAPNQSAHCR